jgi:hypothetical protein
MPICKSFHCVLSAKLLKFRFVSWYSAFHLFMMEVSPVHAQPRSCPGSSAYALGQKVRNEFVSWRQSAKDGLRKIPEKLWQDAIELAAAKAENQAGQGFLQTTRPAH